MPFLPYPPLRASKSYKILMFDFKTTPNNMVTFPNSCAVQLLVLATIGLCCHSVVWDLFGDKYQSFTDLGALCSRCPFCPLLVRCSIECRNILFQFNGLAWCIICNIYFLGVFQRLMIIVSQVVWKYFMCQTQSLCCYPSVAVIGTLAERSFTHQKFK